MFTLALRRVWFWSLLMGLYSCLVPLKEHSRFADALDLPAGLDAVLTVVVGALLAFRANRAYERWWEARTLWGTQVNVSRNLAIKACELGRPNPSERTEIRTLITAFAYALKHHLRDGCRLESLDGFADATERPHHVPSFLVGRLLRLFAGWERDRRISPEDLRILDRELRVFLDVCGGCERIKLTLMPTSWRHFTLQCLAIYLAVLPWGLGDEFDYYTVPLVMIASYVLIAIETVSRYVEEPFGDTEDHLDLDSICREIETSVREIIAGDPPNVPKPATD